MSHVYTQCPHCLTAYEPRAAQLAQGRGLLRCGVCEKEFDALERLSDEPFHHRAAPVLSQGETPRILPEEIPQQGELFSGPRIPGFARMRLGAPLPASSRWWAAAIALALLLTAQIVLAQRDQLAADPAWRPWLVRACATLGCTLTPWRAPERLVLESRDVRPHPSVPGGLLISASFRNRAPHPLAWPVLELSLLDLDGERIALRRFRVDEYLGAMPRERALAPGQGVTATLEIQDPGRQAIAYAFEFL